MCIRDRFYIPILSSFFDNFSEHNDNDELRKIILKRIALSHARLARQYLCMNDHQNASANAAKAIALGHKMPMALRFLTTGLIPPKLWHYLVQGKRWLAKEQGYSFASSTRVIDDFLMRAVDESN